MSDFRQDRAEEDFDTTQQYTRRSPSQAVEKIDAKISRNRDCTECTENLMKTASRNFAVDC
jgi:hypothetical protein